VAELGELVACSLGLAFSLGVFLGSYCEVLVWGFGLTVIWYDIVS
jgi:hypothetical protein